MQWRQALSPARIVSLCCLLLLIIFASLSGTASAVTQPKNPQNGSVGIEGTIPTAAPKQAPTIAVPGNGQRFTGTPITVSGLCPKGLLIKIFSNNVFVGAVECTNGSYSIRVDIFSGRNDLVARAYDALDQASPDSNIVTVTFEDQQFNNFGSHMFLTSAYAKQGANPGETLSWPIVVGAGAPPYAISVSWGDNKQEDLVSVPNDGTFIVKHIYDNAGVFNLTVKGVDRNGTGAFLQLIGVANGAIQTSTKPKVDNTVANEQAKNVIFRAIAISMAIAIPLILASFFIGRKHQLLSLRRHLERSAEHMNEDR